MLRWIDYGGLEKKLMGLSKKMDAFLQGLIDEKRREEGNTMIDHLLSLQKSQPEYYTDQIIKGIIRVSAVHFFFSSLFILFYFFMGSIKELYVYFYFFFNFKVRLFR
jgi:hypothetical protein